MRREFETLSNTGRWGADDAAGTLNLIGPVERLAAVAEVRSGRSVALGLTVRPGETGSGASNMVVTPEADAAVTIRDELRLAPHGWATTHVDALAHCFFDGVAYNGRRTADLIVDDGLREADVLPLARGIVTRGVLLDVPAALGVDRLPTGTVIGRRELDAAEALAGTRVRAGDAIVVRSGLGDAGRGDPGGPVRTGVGVESLHWMRERDVAVYAGDCVDALPSPDPAYPDYFHQLALAAMGLVLLDVPDVPRLAAACAEEGRRTFLLVVAPLAVRGATGSAVNPLAVF